MDIDLPKICHTSFVPCADWVQRKAQSSNCDTKGCKSWFPQRTPSEFVGTRFVLPIWIYGAHSKKQCAQVWSSVDVKCRLRFSPEEFTFYSICSRETAESWVLKVEPASWRSVLESRPHKSSATAAGESRGISGACRSRYCASCTSNHRAKSLCLLCYKIMERNCLARSLVQMHSALSCRVWNKTNVCKSSTYVSDNQPHGQTL